MVLKLNTEISLNKVTMNKIYSNVILSNRYIYLIYCTIMEELLRKKKAYLSVIRFIKKQFIRVQIYSCICIIN